MATRHGTRGTYLATIEEIDIYNEFHKKLLELNFQIMLIDQQLKKLVQECSQRGDILKKVTGQLKEEQENRKRRLRGMLMRFFQSKLFDIDNLESFILEQEAYSLMTTKSDDELNLFMTEITRRFTTSVRKSCQTINSWNRLFDRTPKKLNFRTRNLGQSADRAPIWQPQGLQDRSTSDMEMSLSDVVVEMYGFSRDMALDIQESVASPKLVSEAFKNDSMSDDLDRTGNGFDPMDYLDHQVLSENSEPEDAETLNWKSVAITREKLEDLYPTICYEDEQIVEKGSGSAGFCGENILKAMKVWIFRMESVLCDLVYNLYAMMSDYEPAMNKFQELNSELKEDKERLNGMVPVIAYKILAMPKISCQGVGFNSEKAALHKEIGFDEVIRALKNIITYLGCVLRKTSGLLNAQEMDERALISCQTVANLAEELVKELGLRIYGAKSRLEGCQVASITKNKTSASLTQTCKGKGKERCRE